MTVRNIVKRIANATPVHMIPYIHKWAEFLKWFHSEKANKKTWGLESASRTAKLHDSKFFDGSNVILTIWRMMRRKWKLKTSCLAMHSAQSPCIQRTCRPDKAKLCKGNQDYLLRVPSDRLKCSDISSILYRLLRTEWSYGGDMSERSAGVVLWRIMMMMSNEWVPNLMSKDLGKKEATLWQWRQRGWRWRWYKNIKWSMVLAYAKCSKIPWHFFYHSTIQRCGTQEP